jgi:site-specific DNA-methyltransferase (adenine-specific)
MERLNLKAIHQNAISERAVSNTIDSAISEPQEALFFSSSPVPRPLMAGYNENLSEQPPRSVESPERRFYNEPRQADNPSPKVETELMVAGKQSFKPDRETRGDGAPSPHISETALTIHSLKERYIPVTGDGWPAKESPTHARWRDFVVDETTKLSEGQSGQSWWKLLEGDCGQLLSLLPTGSVDAVVTSPPYYWQRDYHVDGQIGKEPTIDAYVSNIRRVFREVKRVLADSGTVFLNLGDTYYNAKGRPHGRDEKHQARRLGLRAVDGPGLGLPRKSTIGIPWRVALGMIEDGWTLRSPIIWARRSAMPEPSSNDRPWRTYEFIFLFAKSPRYWFNREGLGGEEDIWFIEPDRNSESRGTHYAPYPRKLVQRCLASGCPDGGVVLDPFVGGGTTMAVALDSGRSTVGIELSPHFCQLIRENLSRRSLRLLEDGVDYESTGASVFGDGV